MYLGNIVTNSAVTIITTDETLTVPSSHIAFEDVVLLINEGLFDKAIEVADATKALVDFGGGALTIEGGVIYHNGVEMDNSLTRRIIRMKKEGSDIEPMTNFLKNLTENPSSRAIQETYRFMESNELGITPDGYGLSYKNVNEDYLDKHSRTFDNSIGAVCEMPRNQVMDDPNQTCSAGLHVCSLEYLKGFWGTGGHTMVVKWNPRDVVSVPVDYENSKMRVCKYTVIGEHEGGTEEDTLSSKAVYEESLYDWVDTFGYTD